MTKIVVIGYASIDHVVQLNGPPAPNRTTIIASRPARSWPQHRVEQHRARDDGRGDRGAERVEPGSRGAGADAAVASGARVDGAGEQLRQPDPGEGAGDGRDATQRDHLGRGQPGELPAVGAVAGAAVATS